MCHVPTCEPIPVALIGQAWTVCPSLEVRPTPPDPHGLEVGKEGFPKENEGAAVRRRAVDASRNASDVERVSGACE